MSRDERGFTLIEILISLVIFVIIVVGALGVLGATGTGGLPGAFPTGFVTGRVARDITAATVYLQGLNEFLATLDNTTLCGGSPPCTEVRTRPPGGPTIYGYAVWPPSAQPYQLDWTALTVVTETWHWDGVDRYESGGASGDELWMIQSTLTWNFQGAARSLTMRRFIPYHPPVPLQP